MPASISASAARTSPGEDHLVDELLVHVDRKHHGGTAAVLREHERPLRGLNLLEHRRRVRPELGDRTNVD